MANFPFDNIGDLVKGLSDIIPTDSTKIQLIGIQNAIKDLKKQENEVFSEIGREVYAQDGAEFFPELAHKLRLIQFQLLSAEEKRIRLQEESATRRPEEKEKHDEEKKSERVCPGCGAKVPNDIKFCQECGMKLQSATDTLCANCGADNPPGTRFCGRCGTPYT